MEKRIIVNRTLYAIFQTCLMISEETIGYLRNEQNAPEFFDFMCRL